MGAGGGPLELIPGIRYNQPGIPRFLQPRWSAMMRTLLSCLALLLLALPAAAGEPAREVSADGHETVILASEAGDGQVTVRSDEVYFGTQPDWQNDLRRQVGGLQVADLNGDGWNDVVVGCYISNSYPPYDDWENLIYFNTGGQLEASPSWVSDDEVSTGDVQVGLINDDAYPDVFAANGGGLAYPSVIYFGGPDGPSTTPGWSSAEPGGSWNNYAILFDFDHDGDTDVVTANQGASQYDPYRPLYMFVNDGGTLETVPSWQSAEESIQGFLAVGDWNGDGWEDLGVSKWVNFETGIYDNRDGQLQTTPIWTTGDDDADKGVAFADVDGNGWLDLAVGHDPTQLWSNDATAMTMTWESQASYHGHSDLRFCDLDRDGDQDLVECHFSDGKVHVYLNRDGVLDGPPSWTYDSSSVGTAIALGDLNGDQWPDLVVGNSGEPCVKVFYAVPPTTTVEPATPAVTALRGNYPNPFNPATTIAFELAETGPVSLAIHDAAGRLVRTLAAARTFTAGRHEIRWDGRDQDGQSAAAGVYLCRFAAGEARDMARLVLVK
jgi:hypothetical protein